MYSLVTGMIPTTTTCLNVPNIVFLCQINRTELISTPGKVDEPTISSHIISVVYDYGDNDILQ